MKTVCDCGERVFQFMSLEGDKKFKKYRCGRSTLPRCDYSLVKEFDMVIAEPDINDVKMCYALKENDKVEDLAKLVKQMEYVELAQRRGASFERYENKVLYLSKKLDLPPFMREEQTPGEYVAMVTEMYNTERQTPITSSSIEFPLKCLKDDILDALPVIKTKSVPETVETYRVFTTVARASSPLEGNNFEFDVDNFSSSDDEEIEEEFFD